MSDNPCVRASFVCPICARHKDRGLVVCWVCHRILKRAHDGCYGAFAERRIAAQEAVLARGVRLLPIQFSEFRHDKAP